MSEKKAAWWLSIAPLFFFIAIYLSMGLYFAIPPTVCALAALAGALVLAYKNVDEQISAFIAGAREESVLYMCLILLLAGAFSAVSNKSGGVLALVHMSLSIIPSSLMLPGIFVVSSIVALAMGTSMGTIATIAPVGIGISLATGADLTLTMGAVLSGAMFGDNLSVISDTTIAATGSLNCDMRSKMQANLPLALIAAVLTTLFFFWAASPLPVTQTPDFSAIKSLPYFLVLALAVSGFNVLVVLMIGIAASTIIGFSTGDFLFSTIGPIINGGFLDMAEIFFLFIFVGGLSGIATSGHALSVLLKKCEFIIRGKRSAEAAIAIFVSIADICVANNTIAIVLSGKIAKEIALKYSLSAPRVASLLDIFSCVWQGLLPYGAQILLLASLSQLNPTHLTLYSWYPMTLGLVSIASIIIQWPRKSYEHKLINRL